MFNTQNNLSPRMIRESYEKVLKMLECQRDETKRDGLRTGAAHAFT